jgi:hypothetical protein
MDDMPAKSKAQRRAMAIAEHNPGMLYKRNAGMKKMMKSDMHDFASTPEKGLPKKKGKKRKTDKATADYKRYLKGKK